jgi:hypothetical protein
MSATASRAYTRGGFRKAALRVLGTLLLLTLLTPAWAQFNQQHQAWTNLLQAHVHWNAEGTASAVDYSGLRRDRAMLEVYLQQLAAVPKADFERWQKAERRAFLINAYNAQTVALILSGDADLKSIKDLGSLFTSPWKKRFFTLFGEQQNLDGIEHGLLRGAADYDDPRIHFAVNCASVGCPALRPEAYRADILDAQLEDQTQRFLRDRSRNRLDPMGPTLYLSKIFDWYGEDFTRGFRGTASVAAFAAHYRQELGIDEMTARKLAAGDIEIDFLDYDWSLNRIQP